MGVSPDSTESHRNFIEKQSLDITLLSDPDKETLKAYGAWGMKKNYGKEHEGVIRSTFIISPEGKIAEAWSNVKVRGKRSRTKDAEDRKAEKRVMLTLLRNGLKSFRMSKLCADYKVT